MDMKVKVSFEFFPPKTETSMIQLQDTATILAQLQPEFFSVTFGAGGTTHEGTIGTIKMLQAETDLPIAPHLSCIGSSYEYVAELLHTYQSMGLNRIVALRGDLPQNMEIKSSDMRYASDLVAFIRKETGSYFHIEVAAYPEIHPQALTAEDDIQNLKRKRDAGADSAITQYFFNPDAYFYFLDACAKQGIFMPIIPGIMPITQYARLQRFSNVCGAEIPRWLSKRLEAYGDDHESVAAFGAEVVYNLCQRLVAGGAQALHFYTLNQAEPTVRLLQMLGRQGANFAVA
jgi:methylenetetrahydrofolate reductase (NADPH)